MLKLRNLESFPHLLLFAFLLGRRTRSPPPLLSRSFSILESFALFPLPSDKAQNRPVLVSPTTRIRQAARVRVGLHRRNIFLGVHSSFASFIHS